MYSAIIMIYPLIPPLELIQFKQYTLCDPIYYYDKYIKCPGTKDQPICWIVFYHYYPIINKFVYESLLVLRGCQRVRIKLSCFVLQFLSRDYMLILEVGEVFIR